MKRKDLAVGQELAWARRTSFGTPDINSPLLKVVVLSTDPYQTVSDYDDSERRRLGYYVGLSYTDYPRATIVVDGVAYDCDNLVKREQGPGRNEVLVGIIDGDVPRGKVVKLGELFGPTYDEAVAEWSARDAEIQGRLDAEQARKDADEALGRRLFDALGERYPYIGRHDDPAHIEIDVHVLEDLMKAAGRI